MKGSTVWILFIIFMVGMIVAIEGMINGNTVLIVIGLILAAGGGGVLLWAVKRGPIAKEYKELAEAKEEVKKCIKGIDGGILSLTRTSPSFERLLLLKPYSVKTYKTSEKKLVYTSATVGGVTTGGFSVEGGDTKVKAADSQEHFKLSILNPHKSEKDFEEIEIKSIILSEELLKIAKKTPGIKEYLHDNRIIVVEALTPSDAAIGAYMYGNMTGNYDMSNNAYSEEKEKCYPSATKCSNIIKFLSQSE